MANRMEEQFPELSLRILPEDDPSDPTGALRRRARDLRAEAQRAALIGLGQRIVRVLKGLLPRPGRRPADRRVLRLART